MKRSWIGAGLLTLLLAVSLAVGWGMGKVHSPVEAALYRAASAEDWETAKSAAIQAEQDWMRWQHFRNCFADHTPVEQIDTQFAKLRSVIDETDGKELPSLAAETAQMVSAIGEAHRFRLGNFF